MKWGSAYSWKELICYFCRLFPRVISYIFSFCVLVLSFACSINSLNETAVKYGAALLNVFLCDRLNIRLLILLVIYFIIMGDWLDFLLCMFLQLFSSLWPCNVGICLCLDQMFYLEIYYFSCLWLPYYFIFILSNKAKRIR